MVRKTSTSNTEPSFGRLAFHFENWFHRRLPSLQAEESWSSGQLGHEVANNTSTQSPLRGLTPYISSILSFTSKTFPLRSCHKDRVIHYPRLSSIVFGGLEFLLDPLAPGNIPGNTEQTHEAALGIEERAFGAKAVSFLPMPWSRPLRRSAYCRRSSPPGPGPSPPLLRQGETGRRRPCREPHAVPWPLPVLPQY